jgi:uncharacterized protein
MPFRFAVADTMLIQLAVAAVVLAAAQPAQTATGIPLDAAWKVTIYDLARSKFHHPGWGWQHSERNYRVALELAKGDGLRVDTDVLFAAAFLHDMSAFMPCKDTKLEHGECAAEQSGTLLSAAGFPMEKLPAVQAAERGHMYYSDPGTQPEAIVLHDADSLDFLGNIGAARMISLTGEASESFARAVKTLRTFVRDIPPRLVTKTAQQMGALRAAELAKFLDALDAETFDGKAM